ncbi:MAG: aspartyl protease family protein [Pseudobacter sp.]|uniref:aspartyl protease family protein n=1 Tax=Pseudobacter sp. TaxID=2045420 RepID=UPI003F81EA35
MGLIYAELELINGAESTLARQNKFDRDEVKRTVVRMLVDTGAEFLSINENIQEILQLPVVGTKRVELADGSISIFDIVAPIELKFYNRQTFCEAIVLPGSTEPLLGAIPMEGMDVIVHPYRRELIPHPDHPIAQLKLK